MSSFEPNKWHLRELLIYFLNLNKSAVKAHRLVVETYGEFDIEDKERSGRPKVYEDAELDALLDQDSCQTQEEQCDGQYFE